MSEELPAWMPRRTHEPLCPWQPPVLGDIDHNGIPEVIIPEVECQCYFIGQDRGGYEYD